MNTNDTNTDLFKIAKPPAVLPRLLIAFLALLFIGMVAFASLAVLFLIR